MIFTIYTNMVITIESNIIATKAALLEIGLPSLKLSRNDRDTAAKAIAIANSISLAIFIMCFVTMNTLIANSPTLLVRNMKFMSTNSFNSFVTIR